jgi:class 3 adenylate cyclase
VLGQRMDPETVRDSMEAHFALASEAFVRHGGTVEKFVGDAVMAVFGVPVAHEDDALRACRAALEILGSGTHAGHPASLVSLAVRIGIETGEVVVGDPGRGSTFASGVAVNLAARLQDAASSGQCLLGPQCHRLVRDVVATEPVHDLVLKGFADPVTAYLLSAVIDDADAFAAQPVARLVGRSHELGLLRQAFDRAAGDRTCQLATVLGTAGAGKTRLATEFLSGVEADATVLRGRCLSYGEGVTYWPLVEIVRQAAGLTGNESPDEARARISALLPSDEEARHVVELVAPAAGLGGSPGTVDDTAWALRRLMEALAAHQPLVLLVDDLHWAEPGLLSIINGLSDWSRDAPILILVLARPELLDDVPDWGAGKMNAVAALLEPLHDDEVEELTRDLLHGRPISAGIVERVRQTAGGNPLFVEQLLATMVEEGLPDDNHADLQVPPTIVALLTARLDRLSSTERAILVAASVVGQAFYRAAVAELADRPVDEVRGALESLLRKGLVRPQRSDLPGQDALRFDHVLVRDAAYNGSTKASRSVLHERFARWLEEHTEGPAYDDFIGGHLEAAYRNRVELGAPDETTQRLGQEAAARLAAAGRLLLMGDDHAAIGLLTRALALQPDQGPARWSTQFNLFEAMSRVGPLSTAAEYAAGIRAAAESAGDLAWTTRGRLALADISQTTDPEGATDLLQSEAEQALVVFDQLGDELGLGWARMSLGSVATMRGRFNEVEAQAGLAAVHLTRAGRAPLAQAISLGGPLLAMMLGERPASQGLVEARQMAAAVDGRRLRTLAWGGVCFFATLLGRAEEETQSRELVQRLLPDLRNPQMDAEMHTNFGAAALASGRSAEAVEWFARSCAERQATGAIANLSTDLACYAYALLLAGDHGEARRQVSRSLELGSTDDVLTQALASAVLAWLAAAEGVASDIVWRHHANALRLLEPTELVLDRGLVHRAGAEAARLTGDETLARAHRQRAIDLYDAKENLVGAAAQRALL